MATSLWLRKSFGPTVLDDCQAAAEWALGHDDPPNLVVTFDLLYKFIPYAANQVAQHGEGPEVGNGYWIKRTWNGAVKSGFRFARGKNAELYLAAGKRILSLLAPRYEIVEGAPAEVVYDMLTSPE